MNGYKELNEIGLQPAAFAVINPDCEADYTVFANEDDAVNKEAKIIQNRAYGDPEPRMEGLYLGSGAEAMKPTNVVVRLTTSYWRNERGVYMRKSLAYMKRMSGDFNYVNDCASNGGADELFKMIVNLNECKDGLYAVEMVNGCRDWETGFLEDWDYKLVPLDRENAPANVQGVRQ